MSIVDDLRYALRRLAASPGFTLVVAGTLALAIGANTAIFSVLNAVLLRSLPYADAERLVMVWEDASHMGFPENTPAPANYFDWKEQNQVFAGMAALAQGSFNLTGDGEPERLSGRVVTGDLFSVLGVKAFAGRVLDERDDTPQAPRVAVISHGLWQRRFGGEPDTVGRSIRLDGAPVTVVGVMPPGFRFPDGEEDIWAPIAFTAQQRRNRGGHYLRVVGRLKPGVTIDRARSEMTAIAQRLEKDYPATNARIGAKVVALRDQLTGRIGLALLLIQFVAAGVLAIACANIANLLLARASARRRDLAVRLALGASRMALARQSLVESVVLALAGGGAGILVASWGVDFLAFLVPQSMTAAATVSLDASALGFALATATLTGAVFGLAPVWQASRMTVGEAMKDGSTGVVAESGGGRLRGVLVVSQVSLAVALLIAAGLLIRTFAQLRAVDPGYRAAGVITMRTALPGAKYSEPARRTAFYSQVIERVSALPGVVAVGYTTWLPLTNRGGTQSFRIEGRPDPPPGVVNDANSRLVTTDYLRAMGVPLRRGRLLAPGDSEDATRVAVINETMARQYWPGEDPLGRRFTLGRVSDARWIEIVGVVGDVRQMGLDAPARAEFYGDERQFGGLSFMRPQDLAVRTSADPVTLAPAVRAAIGAVDPDQPVSDVRTLSDFLDREILQSRLQMLLLGGFAALAVILASVGVYSVLAYAVAQRRREIGVRMAFGARQEDVVRLIVRQGMFPAIAGVAGGVLLALVFSRFLERLLYNVTPRDPLTFAVSAIALSAVALLACYLPARRASRVDPLQALRWE